MKRYTKQQNYEARQLANYILDYASLHGLREVVLFGQDHTFQRVTFMITHGGQDEKQENL